MAPFARHGFRHITQLVTLHCAISGETERSSLEFDLEQPPFSAPCRDLLLATHAATLDCPELNFGRTPDDLLAEFLEAAPGTTWHLARRDRVPVGIVILSPAATEGEVDLAYLGVAPSLRGCGLGENLLTFARSEAARRGASSMSVSVDNRNWPALQLYLRNGFVESELRDVWLVHL
jgi:ribosomal protein S18 acetylase RimI-like enzyme